ncbi:MAG TPA: sugar MFS transporter [Puia sp.]|jgi:FHS family L-fucose permease-like MFS transporter|nr:sugar MFS transporter [Puia sp.]
MKAPVAVKNGNYLFPLILVTSLFFLWGLAYGLLDVLNKHFQEMLDVTKARSTLLQAAYFGAYFLVAYPAGLFMNRFGYKKGILLGLLLYAIGALLFYPSAQLLNFNFFLVSLFIIAAGLACLETAANPYITVLGKPETSEFRLNLSQSFNGVGSFLGPIIGANLFFSGNSKDLSSVQYVYLIIGAIVLVMFGLFFKTRLPEIEEDALASDVSQIKKQLFRHANFVNAIVAQFFYVGAQVGIAALFINYCREAVRSMSNMEASYLLSLCLILFTAGRFAGTALMKKIAPHRLLLIYAIINFSLCVIVIWVKGWISVYSLVAVFFFMSIMFPTIFALGVKDLGHHTKKGSSFIIMAIAGGACMPYMMGRLAESSTAHAYIIPMICFSVVAYFGWKGYKTK